MKRLTLLRHAKSSWKDLSLADIDRPLNGRGKRDAPEMGRRLQMSGFRVDAVVTSPARRARRTARAVAREIAFPGEEIVIDQAIYEADVADLLDAVRGLEDEAGHVMLVGHNPGFTDLVNELTGEGIDNLPTAGVVTIDFEADSWRKVSRRKGKLVHFDYPKNPRA